MAVAVSRDLTVQVLEDINAAKLLDRQQNLRSAIQRGEPKCLGVSLHHFCAKNKLTSCRKEDKLAGIYDSCQR